MDAITEMIMSGIDIVGVKDIFIMVCRLMVVFSAVELFGVCCAHLGNAARR